LLVLTVRPQRRGSYQDLFQHRKVRKVYEAVAPLRADLSFPTTVRSRIVKHRGIARAQEEPGEPNAESRIELVDADAERGVGLYRLEPHTGKTHQLRLHMASLGIPILYDTFWPDLREDAPDDHGRPLQLLARSISFTDPVDGRHRHFVSRRTLSAWSRWENRRS
jgi:tRNA pseudouridine32 synthase/23S rRNA pseudouridine746 synthase